jgi:hypothetical protein
VDGADGRRLGSSLAHGGQDSKERSGKQWNRKLERNCEPKKKEKNFENSGPKCTAELLTSFWLRTYIDHIVCIQA